MNPKLKKIEKNILCAKSVCEYEESGYCESPKRCKDKSRIYKEGPRGGMQKTDSFCCMKAL
jgi:hypothetical protein